MKERKGMLGAQNHSVFARVIFGALVLRRPSGFASTSV
jgi:hypothetical protein